MLDPDKFIARGIIGTNQFIKLGLNCGAVAVLRILDHEHHQERDNCRARVDNKLPRIRIAKQWPRNAPHHYHA